MAPAITAPPTPKLIFPVVSGVNQRLFPEQQCRPDVDQSRGPEKQEEADDRDDSDSANAKIRELGNAGTDAENPAVLPVTVKAT